MATGREKHILTGHTAGSIRWRFRRMGGRSQAAVRTLRYGCGTSPQGRKNTPSQDIPNGSVGCVFAGWEDAGKRQLRRYGHRAGKRHCCGTCRRTGCLASLQRYCKLKHPRRLRRRRGRSGFPDFLRFAAQFGQSRGDAGFDARFDLNGDGAVGRVHRPANKHSHWSLSFSRSTPVLTVRWVWDVASGHLKHRLRIEVIGQWRFRHARFGKR